MSVVQTSHGQHTCRPGFAARAAAFTAAILFTCFLNAQARDPQSPKPTPFRIGAGIGGGSFQDYSGPTALLMASVDLIPSVFLTGRACAAVDGGDWTTGSSSPHHLVDYALMAGVRSDLEPWGDASLCAGLAVTQPAHDWNYTPEFERGLALQGDVSVRLNPHLTLGLVGFAAVHHYYTFWGTGMLLTVGLF